MSAIGNRVVLNDTQTTGRVVGELEHRSYSEPQYCVSFIGKDGLPEEKWFWRSDLTAVAEA